jgi:upstream activation factor subunit UAF30
MLVHVLPLWLGAAKRAPPPSVMRVTTLRPICRRTGGAAPQRPASKSLVCEFVYSFPPRSRRERRRRGIVEFMDVPHAAATPGVGLAWSCRVSWYAPARRIQASAEECDVAKKSATKSGRKPNAAFMRPVTPSGTLAEVVGDKPMPRTEITKKLWAYIKKNGLQDKKNKRMINADENLKAVFGGKTSVNMFAMTKLVNRHLK